MAGRERGEVGAGRRLRVALTPAKVPPHDGRKMLKLLRFGPVVQKRRSDHREAEADHRRRKLGAYELLLQDAPPVGA